MHDEGKKLSLKAKGVDPSTVKLEDTLTPIIRCKGILRDTQGRRTALQGLYEHHEFFNLAEEPSTKSHDGEKAPQNQLVFIGVISPDLQSTIRNAVVSCFTNREVRTS